MTTIKLTDAQAAALKAAAKGEGLIEIPANVRGAGRTKMRAALVATGYASEDDNGDLWLTAEGREAMGAPKAKKGKPVKTFAVALKETLNEMMAPAKPKRERKAKEPVAEGDAKPPRESKQAKMIELMRRPEGMVLEDACEEFGWQKHTVRGAIAGALKKKLGLNVVAEKREGQRGMTYRIVD